MKTICLAAFNFAVNSDTTKSSSHKNNCLRESKFDPKYNG